jgi:hypothetical protein
MNNVGLIGSALTALCASACVSQVPTQSACVVAQESGFIGAGGGQTQITVARNGSPCEIAVSIRRGPMGQGEIATPPAHGTATVRTAAEATVISFTPAPDYVGEDRFKVTFGPNFAVTVLVQVVPIAAGSAARR